MSKPCRDSFNILLAGNQERGRSVTQPMERNVGKLLFGGLVLIVTSNGVLEGLIWSAIIHHSSVVLGEYPIFSLPVIPDL